MPKSSLETLHAISRDLIHAARSLKKDRGFTLVCVISLGIGMGALVALATFTRAVWAPARVINTTGLTELLVLPLGPLRAKAGVWAMPEWSYPDYQALRDSNSGMALTAWVREFTPGPAEPDKAGQPGVTTMYVSANYFQTLGVSLARGPGFDPAIDDATSTEPRLVVSDDFWRLRLAADPEAVGKSVLLNGVPHTVVGITPPDFRAHFHFWQAPGTMVFVPLERHPKLKATPNLRDDRTVAWLQMLGRLQPGVSISQANALVTATAAGIAKQYPASNEFKAATVEWYASMGAAGAPESRRVTSVLLSLAGIVLLIVCLNISGMMMVRGAKREKELSIRAALGAGRRSLIAHLFFEAILLAFVSGAISGLVLFGVPVIIAWKIGAPVPLEIDFDAIGLAIASGLCLVVSLVFGLLPALRFSRPNLIHTMKEDAGGGRQTIRVHRFAALVQIGIAVPILVISGVMIDRVRTADLGFDTDGLAATRLPASVEKDKEQQAGFSVRRALENLRQVSGVRAVAMAEGMPVDFNEREFRVGSKTGAKFATAQVTRIGDNFLETIGVKMLRGRTITVEDRMTAAPVAVISEPLARQLFAEAEAIGQRVTLTMQDSKEQEFTVIGVSADFATSQLTTARPQILLPLPDLSTEASAKVEALTPSVFLIVRGAKGDEPKLKAALETELRALGVEPLPGVAFPGIVTGQDLRDKSFGDLVSEGTAVGVAGGLVLVLAALGIVGVVGFMVATRTRELAVRMALGASRLSVFRLMLSDVVKLVIPGVVGGILIAAVLIRTMENVMGTPLSVGPSQLGVMEPVIYAAASVIAITVALLAGLPAARRATSIQPMTAIRSE